MLTDTTRPLLADLYMDALALDWQRRDRLLNTLDRDFAALAQWDERLLAYMRALRLLAPEVRNNLRERLKEPLLPKEYFVLAWFALANADDELIDAAVDLARSIPSMASPLLAAVEWHGDRAPLAARTEHISPELKLRILALSAWQLHSQPEQLQALYSWIRKLDLSPDDVTAALHLIQCAGDGAASHSARNYLDHAQSSLRFAAGRALLALGANEYRNAGATTLETLVMASEPDEVRQNALQCLALHVPDQAGALLSRTDSALPLRTTIKARGWLGLPAGIPELIEHLDDPEHARQAAHAITLMTGSDPHRDGWASEAPPPPPQPDPDTDALPKHDPDAGFPWPSRARFIDWWTSNRARFDPSQRYLAGHPLQSDAMIRILETGPLMARPLAAAHLQRATGRPLFLTHLPASQQRTRFQTFALIRDTRQGTSP